MLSAQRPTESTREIRLAVASVRSRLYLNDCETSRSRLRHPVRRTTGDRTAAHRRSDQRRVYLFGDGFRKRVVSCLLAVARSQLEVAGQHAIAAGHHLLQQMQERDKNNLVLCSATRTTARTSIRRAKRTRLIRSLTRFSTKKRGATWCASRGFDAECTESLLAMRWRRELAAPVKMKMTARKLFY